MDVAEMGRNRRAQNGLMTAACKAHDVTFLDLTNALERTSAAGVDPYFTDDSHWNAAGHALAARELAAMLSPAPLRLDAAPLSASLEGESGGVRHRLASR